MKSFLYNKSLKSQFNTIFYIITLAFICTMIFSIFKINEIESSYRDTMRNDVVVHDDFNTIITLIDEIQNDAMGNVLNGENNNLDATFLKLDGYILDIYNTDTSYVDKDLFKTFHDNLNEYRDYLTNNGSKKVTSRTGINTFYNRSNEYRDKVLTSLSDSAINGYSDVNTYFVNTQNETSSIFWKMLIAQIAFLIIATILYSILSKGVVTRVKNLTTVSTDMKNGFISNTSKSTYNDEISTVTNSLIDSSIEMVETINNFENIVTLAKNNKLNEYTKIENFTGNYETINNCVSDLLDISVINTENIALSIENMSNGEFDTQISYEEGSNKAIYNSLNLLSNSLVSLRDSILSKCDSLKNGDFNVTDESDFVGDFYVINSSVNDAIKSLSEPISAISNGILDIENGNLDNKVSLELSGEFLVLKNNINNAMDSIKLQNASIENIIDEISNGNLLVNTNAKYKGDYKNIETAIKNMTEQLGGIIGHFNNNSKDIESYSKIIVSSSTFLQNDSMEEFTKISDLEQKIDRVDNIVKNTDDKMDGMRNTASLLSVKATDCNDKMNEMLGSMQDINSASLDISKIIKVIEEIAFQTNLLALNAAVESARAGVHGKGFAVVAEEVRNLAQRSQKAAKETTALIEHTVRKVSDGSDIANETANKLKEMIDDVSSITSVIEVVTDTTKNQSLILNSFKDSVKEISNLTKNNIDHASNCVKVSETLEENVTKLNEDTKMFMYNSNGVTKFKENSNTKIENPKVIEKRIAKAKPIIPTRPVEQKIKPTPVAQKPKTAPIVQKPKPTPVQSKPIVSTVKPKIEPKPKEVTPLKKVEPKNDVKKPFAGNIHQINIDKNSHSTHLNVDDNLPKEDILIKRVEVIKPKSEYGLTSDVFLKDSADKTLLTDDEIERMISTKTFGKYL